MKISEPIIYNLNLLPTSEEKIEAVAKIICQAGDEPAAALLVLMATLENASHPKHLQTQQALRLHSLCRVKSLRHG